MMFGEDRDLVSDISARGEAGLGVEELPGAVVGADKEVLSVGRPLRKTPNTAAMSATAHNAPDAHRSSLRPAPGVL